VGAKQIWVMMEHTTRDAQPRLLERCTLPLTAVGVVAKVFTNLAIIDVTADGFVVQALCEGATLESVQRLTGAPLKPAPTLRRFSSSGMLTPPL